MDKPIKQEIAGRNKDGTFPKGVSGNPEGRPKRKTLTEMIHEELDKKGGWESLVDVIVTMAKRKDKDILKEIWRYTDGMPQQKTDITSGGQPIQAPILGGVTKENDIQPDTGDSETN